MCSIHYYNENCGCLDCITWTKIMDELMWKHIDEAEERLKNLPPGCDITDGLSSRACEKGTKGCVIYHG